MGWEQFLFCVSKTATINANITNLHFRRSANGQEMLKGKEPQSAPLNFN